VHDENSMMAENRVRARLIFLIIAAVIVILALLVVWIGGAFLINLYAQGKISEAITSLNLEKNVRYREANHNLFTGATVLRDVEVKLSESASPIKVAELRIDHFREENGVPIEANFTADNFLVEPSCMTNLQMQSVMVLAGLNPAKGNLHCDIAINSADRTLKVRRYTIHFDDLIDATLQLECDDVDVVNWKNAAQGSGLSAGVRPIDQLLVKANIVSFDSELVDLGLTDKIIDWGARFSRSTKEQFRITAQQQLMTRMPDSLAAYRSSLAQIFQQRCRAKLSLHPAEPINVADILFTDPRGIEERLGIKLEVTPVGR
jgi:hypothetical protein